MKNAVSNNSSDFVEGQITHYVTKVTEDDKDVGGEEIITISGKRIYWVSFSLLSA